MRKIFLENLESYSRRCSRRYRTVKTVKVETDDYLRVQGKRKETSILWNEAIRTVQFIRNSCLKYWMDNKGINKFDLSKYGAILAKNFPFANQLNSTAPQAASERVWSSIVQFFVSIQLIRYAHATRTVISYQLSAIALRARYANSYSSGSKA